MNSKKLPQLRVLVTDYCDSNCLYCRPGGEGTLSCRNLSMSEATARRAATAYRALGGTDIKISGGDPALWGHLTEYVAFLKYDLGFEHVELITRSTKILPRVKDLNAAGLDILNFSLDTLSADRYTAITGKRDLPELLEVISASAQQLPCKINTVILADTTEEEVSDLLNFCLSKGIRELKLLDYIDDLKSDAQKGTNQQKWFEAIYRKLDEMSEGWSYAFQGGLGHPMRVYQVSELFRVICKDASQGAWYCGLCKGCGKFPCHDALMALRVTPSNSFQLCLANPEQHWYFGETDLEQKMGAALAHYRDAFFVGGRNHENHYIDLSKDPL